MSLNWVTPPGFLFTATETQSVSGSVQATGTATQYSIISGSLPAGISLSSTGTFSGTAEAVIKPTTSTFVVRAVDSEGNKKDRTFEIFVPCNNPPVWSSPQGFIQQGLSLQGFVLNNQWVDIKFTADAPLVHEDLNDYNVTYKIDKSFTRLPRGLILTPTGRLQGTIAFDLLPGEYYPFSFKIIASDGYATSEQLVTINLIDSDTFRVDTTALVLSTGTQTISLIDLAIPGSASYSFLQPPEFLNGTSLGTIHSDDKHYIPVTAYDAMPMAGPIVYSITTGTTPSTNLPQGLDIEPNIGYLYGYISTQTEYLKNYSITVNATKIDNLTGNSITATNTFTLGVLADNYDKFTWITDSNLGTISQGIDSELSILATHTETIYNLQYRVSNGSLPPGIVLYPNGDLIGASTASGAFTATVLVSTATYTNSMITGTVFPYAFSTQTFVLNVTPVSEQYTSMYVKPMLSVAQRTKFTNFINSASIFLPEVLYRAEDPKFGVQTELKMFLEFGIEKLNLDDYASALQTNFYRRRLAFGDLKVAIAKDSQGNHVYDAVYVDIVDDLAGARSAITINNKVYYPGSIDNMRNSLGAITLDDHSLISIDEYHLPKFMRTAQRGSYRPTNYIKAVILCYTLPNQSSKITSRIRASGFDFKLLNFEIDRITVQNSLDYDTAKYLIFPRSSITDE